MPSIEPIIRIYQSFGDSWWIPVAVTVLVWGLLTAALGAIYKRADQPFIAAFIPVWNIYVFYKLGGYSAIWTIVFFASIIVPALAAYNSAAALLAIDSIPLDQLGITFASLGFLTLASGVGLFLSGVVLFLSAYNIGRAFNKDALMAILFLVALPIWLIALSFTRFEWDEAAANPNSIGRMPDYRVARNRYKTHTKKVKKRKQGRADDDDDFMIIDGGSAEAKFDGINFVR